MLRYLQEHKDFNQQHGDVVTLSITDEMFVDRLVLAEQAVRRRIERQTAIKR